MIKCQCNPEINTFYTIEIRTNFITTIRMLNLVSEKMKQPRRPLNFYFFFNLLIFQTTKQSNIHSSSK